MITRHRTGTIVTFVIGCYFIVEAILNAILLSSMELSIITKKTFEEVFMMFIIFKNYFVILKDKENFSKGSCRNCSQLILI